MYKKFKSQINIVSLFTIIKFFSHKEKIKTLRIFENSWNAKYHFYCFLAFINSNCVRDIFYYLKIEFDMWHQTDSLSWNIWYEILQEKGPQWRQNNSYLENVHSSININMCLKPKTVQTKLTLYRYSKVIN